MNESPEPNKISQANEEARKKLEKLLSPKEQAERGFHGGPEDLSELSDPILESNLKFLLEMNARVEEWEARFIENKSLTSEKRLIESKILMKEIVDRSAGMSNSVSMLEKHGGMQEKADLEKLNARLAILKRKILEVTNPSSHSLE